MAVCVCPNCFLTGPSVEDTCGSCESDAASVYNLIPFDQLLPHLSQPSIPKAIEALRQVHPYHAPPMFGYCFSCFRISNLEVLLTPKGRLGLI